MQPYEEAAVSALRVVAIATEIAETVRSTMKAPGYGHPAHVETALGDGPCRHCLDPFRVGVDARILFTYDAFHDTERLPLPGPVFVHERACTRYAEDRGIPAALLHIPMTLNAYGAGRKLVAQEYARGNDAEPEVRRLLERTDVAYVHVRNTEAGCYMFRVERDQRL
jgi:hypothetical protein